MKKTYKRIIVMLLVTAMLVLFTACKAADTPAGNAAGNSDTDKVYKIRYGGTLAESHYSAISIELFKELVEEKSDGRIEVDIFHNLTIGTPRDLIEGAQMNTVQMFDCSIAAYEPFTDLASPLSLPFFFPNREAAFKFVDGEMGQELAEAIAEETGVRIVGWHENGFRQLTNSKKEVSTPDDLKGLKIRVMDSPLYIKLFESMGALATPMASAEMFTAMQQGTVDGQDNPIAVVESWRFYEVQNYMSDLNHTFDFLTYSVSEEFYKSLPEDLRQIFDECMVEAVSNSRQLAIDMEKASLEVLSKELQYTHLTSEERQAFADLTDPVYEWYVSERPHLADKVREYQAEIEKLK